MKKSLFHLKNQPPQPPVEEDDDILPPSRVGSQGIWVSLICGALIVAMIVTSLPKAQKDNTSVDWKILSGKPQMHSISSVITGAGTLASGDTETIEIPAIVSLDKYYVHNGDSVQPGDILASTDQVAAAYAVTQLQPILNTLDLDINYYDSQNPGTQIRTTADGRVKAIFGQVGDKVADVVYEHGALALLSMDGMMMVTFTPTEALTPGQKVTVHLPDGSTEQGRVDTVANGEATVTLPDQTAPYGELASISFDGKTIGEGRLEIHNSFAITGYFGTISQIDVHVDQDVYRDKIFFYLTDTGKVASYETLLERRRELEEQMDALIQLSYDGFLRATQPGIVADIPSDADFATLEEIAAVKKLAAGEEQIILQFLRNETWNTPELVLLGDEGDPEGSVPGSSDAAESKSLATIVNILGNTLYLMVRGETQTYTFEVEDPAAYADVVMVTVTLKEVDGVKTVVGVEPYEFTFHMPSFSFGGFGGFGTPAAKSYDTYDDSKTKLMTLIPQDQMTVTMSVDELDILQLEEGMEAEIRLDAFRGKVFPGTITRIGAFGENAGGNTKFPVEVTLNTEAQMLLGMNASVRVVTETSPEVLTVPAEALQEEGGKTYLYTGYDAKNDTLTGRVEVTTGMSDGENVELLSGLPENASFYYRYANSLTYNFV